MHNKKKQFCNYVSFHQQCIDLNGDHDISDLKVKVSILKYCHFFVFCTARQYPS